MSAAAAAAVGKNQDNNPIEPPTGITQKTPMPLSKIVATMPSLPLTIMSTSPVPRRTLRRKRKMMLQPMPRMKLTRKNREMNRQKIHPSPLL